MPTNTDSQKPTNILYATSEVRPFLTAGGLGSVARDLPIEFARQGHNATVIAPWYDSIAENLAKHEAKTGEKLSIENIGEVDIPFDGETIKSKVGKCVREGVTYLFVEPAHFENLSIDRPSSKAYSSSVQNGQTFNQPPEPEDLKKAKKAEVKTLVHFNKAIPQAVALAGIKPDVVNANDWQTGLLPLVLQHSKKDDLPENFRGLPSTISLHRAEFVGDYVPSFDEVTKWLELDKTPSLDVLKSEMKNLYHDPYGEALANPLGIGCELVDKINTVSNGYRKELIDNEFWTQYNRYDDKLVGIVNRIDMQSWNPKTIKNIHNFSADDLSGREKNRKALIEEYGFTDSQKPLLVYGGRISPEKGLDLLNDSLEGLVEQGYNVLIGGPINDEALGKRIAEKAAQFPGQVHFAQGNQDLKKFFSGADFSIVPSLSEPCGVVQMESQSVGGIPIGRAVGGIPDTIEDGHNGLLFNDYKKEDLLAATQTARGIYDNKEQFTQMQKNCILTDNSMSVWAKAYLEVYDEIAKARRNYKPLSVYNMCPRNYNQLEDGRSTFKAMKDDVRRVAALNYEQIYVNPFYQTGGAPKKDQGYIGSMYATKDTRVSNPAFFGEAAPFVKDGLVTKQGQEVKDFCDEVSKHGITPMFDLAQSHLSPDSPIIQEALEQGIDIIKRHPNGKPAIHNLDENHQPLVDDPKHVWDDAVVLNYDDPKAKEFIVNNIFAPYAEQMAELGFKGIRVDSTLQTPTDVHQRVTDAFKAKLKQVDKDSYQEPVIMAETLIDKPGYDAHEVKNIATHCYSSGYFYPNNTHKEKNADTLFNIGDINSVDNWLKAEMWRKQKGINGGVITPVSTHDEPRLAANLEQIFGEALGNKSAAERQAALAKLARIKVAFGAFFASGGHMMLGGDEFLMKERINVFDGRVVSGEGHKLAVDGNSTLSQEHLNAIKEKAEKAGVDKIIHHTVDGNRYAFTLRDDTYKQSIADWDGNQPPQREPVLVQVAVQEQIPQLAQHAGHSADKNLTAFISNVNQVGAKLPESSPQSYADIYISDKDPDIWSFVRKNQYTGLESVVVTDMSGKSRHTDINPEIVEELANQSGVALENFKENMHLVGDFRQKRGAQLSV